MKFSSLDQLFNSILRGNEIQFEFGGKEYFILPHYLNEKIVGAIIGEAYTDKDRVCLSVEEFQSAVINGFWFGDVFDKINITWRNF